MTAPSGLLEYGQGGAYDAVNDRAPITVLANFMNGVAKAATMTPGSGLNVTVGPWAAIMAAGDGTSCIAFSATNTTVVPAAGGAAARTDVVWVDIDVANGAWTLNLRSTTDIVGRQGIEIGRITVPANANASSAMSFAPAARSWNPYPPPVVPRAAAGSATIAFRHANTASVAVVFPSGRFTSPPKVVATTTHGSFFAYVSAITANGFTLSARSFNSSLPTITITVEWMARDTS